MSPFDIDLLFDIWHRWTVVAKIADTVVISVLLVLFVMMTVPIKIINDMSSATSISFSSSKAS